MIKDKSVQGKINEEQKHNKTPKLSREEIETKDKIQAYVKNHIFYEPEIFQGTVPPLFWRRISGVLEGKRYSNISRGEIKQIYTYDEIYETLLYCTSSIDFAMKNMNFDNVTHLINYIIKIIEGNIGDIHVLHIRKQKQQKRIEELNKYDSDINESKLTKDKPQTNNGYITKESTDVDEDILEEFF